MHKIVLTSSAMWLVDLVKNTMSSTVPENMHPEAEQFSFHVFKWIKRWQWWLHEKPGWFDRCIYGTNCVSYHTVCRWIEGFTAGKVSFELETVTSFHDVQFQREQANCFFVKKCTEEDPYVTICEAGERCDVSIDTAESIVLSNLSLRKIVARWVPHLLMEQSKKQESWMFQWLAENVWTRWTRMPPWRLHRWWNPAVFLQHANKWYPSSLSISLCVMKER